MAQGGSVPVLQCPACGQRGKWNPTLAGRKLKCRCGASFTAPALPEASTPPASDGDEALYDLTPTPDASSAHLLKSAQPASPPFQTPPQPLNYHRPEPISAFPAGRIAVDDPWEGNKAKNLFLPITLILASTVFNFMSEAFFRGNASVGMAAASKQMTFKLATEIPVMLLACLIAVRWLDVSFGPLWPAILKLSSISLAPDALWGLMMLAGALAGHSKGFDTMIVGALLGWLIGWAVGLLLYFALFIFYFGLEFFEALRLTFLIRAFRMTVVFSISIISSC